MIKLLPYTPNQARQMTVCRSSNNAPQECGHWYSPIAVEELIQAACASKQQEIDELQQRFNDMEDDYLRRHKDAVDWYEQTLELSAQVEVMRDALDNLMLVESRGRIMPIGDAWDKARTALSLTPSEALTHHDARVKAEIEALRLSAQISHNSWVAESKELVAAQAEIARLNHQHANDEAANRMLSEACNNLRNRTINECAALFSGGVRNRELYVNDVEETILGLLKE